MDNDTIIAICAVATLVSGFAKFGMVDPLLQSINSLKDTINGLRADVNNQRDMIIKQIKDTAVCQRDIKTAFNKCDELNERVSTLESIHMKKG